MYGDRRMWQILGKIDDCPGFDKQMSDAELLRETKVQFNIGRILYPACWRDSSSLESTYEPQQIVYLDHDARIIGGEDMQGRRAVIGDIEHPPFGDEVFDGAFLQDGHLSERGLDQTLRTLRPGGALIFSSDDCGLLDGIQPKDLLESDELKVLPIHSEFYLPFVKK